MLELLSVTCGHCIAYARTENSYQTNGPNGTNVARFLGLEVNSSTDSAAIANFMSTYGVTMPIADNVSPVGINYQLYLLKLFCSIPGQILYNTMSNVLCNYKFLFYNRKSIKYSHCCMDTTSFRM